MKLIIALLAACLLLGAGVSWAAAVSYEASVSPQTASWAQSAVFPKFNPVMGTLTAVKVSLTGSVDGTAGIESFDAEAQQVEAAARADIAVFGPDKAALVSAKPAATKTAALAAFDGSNDFAGASGATLALVSPQQSADAQLASGIASFVGADEIALDVVSRGESSVGGSGNIGTQISGKAAAKVVVTYIYQP